jgi:ABC-type antimicrobial peptide transport system permease subunit
MVLGATPREIFRTMVGPGMILTTIGVTIGLAAALALTRLRSTLLFGVNPADLRTFALTTLVIVIIALLASHLPARRAARVNPIAALRLE